MNRKEVWGVLAVLIVFSLCSGFVFAEYEVSKTLLKKSVSGEKVVSENFEVADGTQGEFVLSAVSVPGISFSEERFDLQLNEKKTVEVYFNSTGIAPGVYAGHVEVQGPVDGLTVPLIFEVESDDVFFDANLDIPPIYTEVERGAKVVYQVKMFDLTAGGGLQEGLGPVSVDAEFNVMDLEGDILISQTEQFIVNQQAQVTNTVTFPEGVGPGTYVLSVAVKYKTSVGTSSQIFSIVESEKKGGFEFEDSSLLIIVGIALVIFLGIVFLFVYLLKERDEVLSELKRYNSREIREVKKLMNEQTKVLRRNKAKRKSVALELNAKIKKLEKKQAARVQKMKKLKGEGHIKEMKRQLAVWKSQGYNISSVEYKFKDLPTAEMQKILKRWKAKYAVKKPKVIKRKKSSKGER